MEKTLLLISADPQDQAFAAEVAVQTGQSLRVIADPKAAMAVIAEGSATTIFADVSTARLYTTLESAIQETVGLFSDRINANTIHFLSTPDLQECTYLKDSPIFGNFVLKNYGDPVEAGAHYSRIVRASLSDRAFGLKTLLSADGKIQPIQLQVSSQKQEAVEAVKKYLIAAKVHSRMANVVANAVDELIMNAIYAAPADDLGKPLLNATARNTLIKLEGRNAIEASVGFDGKYVAFSAADKYGSLDKAKLIQHLSKVYTEEEYKLKTNVAGAGLGLATLFRWGGSFLFSTEAGNRTEVTFFLKRFASYKDFKKQFRFVSTQYYL
ncbi:MAG: hypothetical protein H7222_11180 [Methylotenera sp.]|nr:hypothetical protein [Oligoflexia bacterium]